MKVLQELATLKGLKRRVPEEVLPLPKEQMASLLHRSTHPKKDQLIELLAMFESGATTSLFLAHFVVHLVCPPALLSLAYAVAIAVQGASWLWVPIAVVGGVGAFFATSKLALVEKWATFPKWKRRLWVLSIEFADTAVVACWGAVWVRLVIMSGLRGLYRSAWVGFDGFGIFAALLSLVLGYFFSKQFNAFFFFVTQYTSRRQFRAAVAA